MVALCRVHLAPSSLVPSNRHSAAAAAGFLSPKVPSSWGQYFGYSWYLCTIICLYRFRLLLYIAAKTQFFDISEWSFEDWFCRTFPRAFTEDHLRWKFLGTNWHDSRNNGQQNQFLINYSEMTLKSPWLHEKKILNAFRL